MITPKHSLSLSLVFSVDVSDCDSDFVLHRFRESPSRKRKRKKKREIERESERKGKENCRETRVSIVMWNVFLCVIGRRSSVFLSFFLLLLGWLVCFLLMRLLFVAYGRGRCFPKIKNNIHREREKREREKDRVWIASIPLRSTDQ